MEDQEEPIEEQVLCGDCNSPMDLKSNKYGLYYGCTNWPECNGIHSAHKKTGLPMGIPADKETRQWRKKAHTAFDRYWKKWDLKRYEAYQMLSMALHLSEEKTHIAMFDKKQCQEVIKICEEGLRVTA